MNGTNRADIRPGSHVLITLKEDQRSGKLTEGIVKNILTKSMGSPNKINNAKATLLALSKLRYPKEEVAKRKSTPEVKEEATGG